MAWKSYQLATGNEGGWKHWTPPVRWRRPGGIVITDLFRRRHPPEIKGEIGGLAGGVAAGKAGATGRGRRPPADIGLELYKGKRDLDLTEAARDLQGKKAGIANSQHINMPNGTLPGPWISPLTG